MQTVNAVRGNARTFLTHLFGAGLDDEDRYVVERFRSMASGEIRRRPGDKAPAKGRREGKTQDRFRAHGEEAAPGARRDHRLYRNPHQGRHANLGRSRGVLRGRATGLHPAFNSNPVGGTRLCPIETPIWAACVTANGSGEGPPSAGPGGCA